MYDVCHIKIASSSNPHIYVFRTIFSINTNYYFPKPDYPVGPTNGSSVCIWGKLCSES